MSDPVKVFITNKRKSLFSEQTKTNKSSMSEVQLRVKHNIATYDLKFNEEETLGTLGHKLLELTGFFCVSDIKICSDQKTFEALCYIDFLGVPVSGQKMICSGKQLNTGEGWIDKSIKEVSATKLEQPGFDR